MSARRSTAQRRVASRAARCGEQRARPQLSAPLVAPRRARSAVLRAALRRGGGLGAMGQARADTKARETANRGNVGGEAWRKWRQG